MLIELFDPHKYQKEIIDGCLDDNNFFITSVISRQFGKSALGYNLAMYWALSDPGCIVMWVAPIDNQAVKVYREIVDCIYESGCIKSKKQPRGDTQIVFKNGSKILFKSAASEDSLRGNSVDYMILDEAAFMKKTTVDTILLPMLNVRGKKCVVLTTPKGKNWVYDWYIKGLDTPRWKSYRFTCYDSPLINQDVVTSIKLSMNEEIFKQEYLAEFIDSSSLFSNISECMILNELESPQQGKNYWAGVDIGLITDATVLSIIDENGHLVKYYRWKTIESPDLIDEIIKINNQWKFKKILIESNNQGLPIIQELKRRTNNIEGFNTTGKSKPEIIDRLVHLFNMKQIKLIKDEYLKKELEGFVFKQKDNGTMQYFAENGFHDDCVMSLAIAINCFENNRYSGKYSFY
jgi:hypothetical protein